MGSFSTPYACLAFIVEFDVSKLGVRHNIDCQAVPHWGRAKRSKYIQLYCDIFATLNGVKLSSLRVSLEKLSEASNFYFIMTSYLTYYAAYNSI